MNSCISCQTNVSKENLIPQLDGNGQVECENCERNFKTEEELKKHMEEHEWGCDDCRLCLTSKYFADLHELKIKLFTKAKLSLSLFWPGRVCED